jgi:hypothetical protein
MTTRKHLPSATAFEMPLMTDTRKGICNVLMVRGLNSGRCGESFEGVDANTKMSTMVDILRLVRRVFRGGRCQHLDNLMVT